MTNSVHTGRRPTEGAPAVLAAAAAAAASAFCAFQAVPRILSAKIIGGTRVRNVTVSKLQAVEVSYRSCRGGRSATLPPGSLAGLRRRGTTRLLHPPPGGAFRKVPAGAKRREAAFHESLSVWRSRRNESRVSWGRRGNTLWTKRQRRRRR